MSFEELDYQETPLGAISLRKRSEPRLGGEILYEVKLGEEFLMSSLFTEAEIQLSKISLSSLHSTAGAREFDIVVGGLGLGYTAVAALEDPEVRSLTVIEVMAPVIDWCQRGLIPNGDVLISDQRCSLVQADFFEYATRPPPFELVHAVLLDIDHSPSHWLAPKNSAFYSPTGMLAIADRLHPGGVFGLWSNDPPEDDFVALLSGFFHSVDAHNVSFPNPYSGAESANTVYVASKRID
jgi:spermidine synthase